MVRTIAFSLLLGGCSSALPAPDGGTPDLATPGATDGAVDLAAADASGADLAAGPDLAATNVGVPCPNTPCPTGNGMVCCVSPQVQLTCQPPPCANGDYTYPCDGPEDCGPGLRCCLEVQDSHSICAPDCGQGYRLCHSPSDCAANQMCDQLEFGPPNFFACF
jgi:hypothetical protein